MIPSIRSRLNNAQYKMKVKQSPVQYQDQTIQVQDQGQTIPSTRSRLNNPQYKIKVEGQTISILSTRSRSNNPQYKIKVQQFPVQDKVQTIICTVQDQSHTIPSTR